MASTNSPQTLVGDFKNLYKSSGLVDAIPNFALIQKLYPFEMAEYGTGEFFVFGVILTKENGATYAPSSGVNSGPQTLNASVAGQYGQAQVQGYAIYMRARLAYDAAAKASQRGKKAFAQAYACVIKNLKESHQYRLELSLLYGQSGLGKVSGNATGVLTITDATWSAGTWSGGLNGAILEAFTGTGDSVSQHNGDLTITSVDIANKTVTVSGTSNAVVANDILYFKGARTTTGFNEAPGLYKILTNAGSLFNIDASTYNLWKSQYYAVNGNLSLTAIFQAAAIGMAFGLESARLLVSPDKFAQLASDEAALRRYVQDTRETDRGVKGISFLMGNVDVEIMPHPMVRDGSAMMIPKDGVNRAGATDVTLGFPGNDEPMEVHVTDVTALEIRSMSDQGIFIEMPAKAILLDLIS
jgi:hypothetical protein